MTCQLSAQEYWRRLLVHYATFPNPGNDEAKRQRFVIESSRIANQNLVRGIASGVGHLRLHVGGRHHPTRCHTLHAQFPSHSRCATRASLSHMFPTPQLTFYEKWKYPIASETRAEVLALNLPPVAFNVSHPCGGGMNGLDTCNNCCAQHYPQPSSPFDAGEDGMWGCQPAVAARQLDAVVTSWPQVRAHGSLGSKPL